RLHRFVRLRRKLGWITRELDKALTALGALDITDQFIVQLSYIHGFRTRFKLRLIKLLSWWSNLDTSEGDHGTKSLYEERFQSKAVLKPKKDDPFALNDDRTDLKNLGLKLSDHIPGVIAALGSSAADLALLTN